MAHSHSSSRGCGSCGGSHQPPAREPTSPYDPCAGGLSSHALVREGGCGCGCGGRGGCRAGGALTPRQKTYGDCAPWKPSCESQDALRECAKAALCDLLRCMSELLCPDGKFDYQALQASKTLSTDLVNCLGQAACSFMHCLPDALCADSCPPAKAPIDCLPCGYAVEVVR
jgi:hypothetical protein